ncbi:hypothetical protein [Burkholderia glumae]|nr:hypothetical protein [Burkholderia glumae]
MQKLKTFFQVCLIFNTGNQDEDREQNDHERCAKQNRSRDHRRHEVMVV